MEAVAALGVAAAAFQFFDAAAKALVLCKQIRDSEKGTTDANHEREHHVDELKKICAELRPDLLATDRQIAKTRDECIKIGDELHKLLNSFKPSSRSRWLCLRAAFRVLGSSKKIKDLQDRLAESQKLFHAAVSVETLNVVLGLQGDRTKSHETLRKEIVDELRKGRAESAQNHKKTHDQLTELQHDTQRDQLVSQKATETLQTALVGAEVTAKRKEVLHSLEYAEMFNRQQAIKPPASGTFEWIFDDSPPKADLEQDEHARLRGKFARWLRSDDQPIFWVSGKAGSGKSSLMSFVQNDLRTRDALSTWSGGQELHEFYFYFWRPGSALQKSIHGLLRSLLFQLAGAKREVVDLILSIRPRTYNGWTTTSLLAALRLSLDAFQNDRIFFMVDGLDEFDGEYVDLLDLLLEWRNKSYIKTCLASRPETAIMNKLESFPTLRLQDLNHEDISKFVWEKLGRYEARLTTALIDEIIRRAEGVFLWAVLVAKSMNDG
jgi:hypothetical protein